MNGEHIRNLVHDYIDGALSAGEMKRVEEHVASCRECRAELSAMMGLVSDLRALPRSIEPPPELLESVDAAIREKQSDAAGIDARRNGVVKESPAPPGLRLIPGGWALRIAASLILLIAASGIWLLMRQQTPEEKIAASRQPQNETQPGTTSEPPGRGMVTPEATTAPPAARTDESVRRESMRLKKDESKQKAGARIPVPGPSNDVAAAAPSEEHKDKKAGEAETFIDRGVVEKSAAPAPELSVAAAAVSGVQENAPAHYKLVNPSGSGSGFTGNISGRMIDSASGDVLIGVNVVVEGTYRGAVTDADGRYTIVGVPAGTYSLKVTDVGYRPLVVPGVVVAGKCTTQLDASLSTAEVEVLSLNIAGEAAKPGEVSTNVAPPATMVPENRGIVSSPRQNSARQDAGQGAAGGRGIISKGYHKDEYPHLYPVPIPHAWNTEQYDHVGENRFRDPQKDPLSTFSIDVDNASYSNVRRFITGGQLPPADAVRVEEMVNYFTYDYPEPRGEHPFTVTTEMSGCPWNPAHRLLLIGLQGKHLDEERLPAANLVFLIDVSGSMNEPEKLPLVKSAFRLLVSRLREDDRVAIVTYAGRAGLALPATSGDQKRRILDVIDGLEAGGSTAGGEGINLAYRIARENFRRGGNNRVILATDGDFNVGVSNDDDLVRLIEEQRADGISLSVLGFGTGNLKDAKMEKLADHGNGTYAYIDRLEEARKVFVSQMAGTLNTIAKDVKIQIEFNPGRVEEYRLVGYENRLLDKEDFNNDARDAGDLGSGHTVTALYEIVPANRTVSYRDVDTLRYQKVSSSEHADEILTLKLRYKEPNGSRSRLLTHTLVDRLTGNDETSENFRFAASVAEFGLLLKNSQFKGSARYDDILSLARGAMGSDREGYRAEFLHLVESAKMLAR